MSYISPFSKDKAKEQISVLVNKFHDDDALLEEKVVAAIEKAWTKSVRNKRFAKVLLHVSFYELGAISGETYDRLRRDMGVVEYDKNTKETIQDKWQREKPSDPFGYLNKQNQNLEGEKQWL